MKIRKFVGATMREALTQVRNALGQEAVILSNRDTPHGVELLAIAEQHLQDVVTPTEADLAAVTPSARTMSEPVDLRAEANREPPRLTERLGTGSPRDTGRHPLGSLLDSLRGRVHETPRPVDPPATGRHAAAPAQHAAFAAAPAGGAAAAATPSRPASASPLRADAYAAPRANASAAPTVPMRTAADTPAARPSARAATPAGSHAAPAAHSGAAIAAATPTEQELLAELRSLRGLMEQRFSALVWHDSVKRRSRAAGLLWELLAAGFSTALARAAVNAVPDEYEIQAAREWLYGQLVPKLRCVDGEADLVARGGIYAFTGPTGVGKTTTAAKIAARCVVKHGADSLGLVTTDTYRIGAHDQLRVFGRILGVPVHAVHDGMGLADVLAQLRGKRLVLIDTIGMGQRDDRVAEQHQMLDACSVRKIVVLSATSQLEALEDIVDAYASAVEVEPALGAIVTKVDEAVKL